MVNLRFFFQICPVGPPEGCSRRENRRQHLGLQGQRKRKSSGLQTFAANQPCKTWASSSAGADQADDASSVAGRSCYSQPKAARVQAAHCRRNLIWRQNLTSGVSRAVQPPRCRKEDGACRGSSAARFVELQMPGGIFEDLVDRSNKLKLKFFVCHPSLLNPLLA